jgi:hypothetical protein
VFFAQGNQHGVQLFPGQAALQVVRGQRAAPVLAGKSPPGLVDGFQLAFCGRLAFCKKLNLLQEFLFNVLAAVKGLTALVYLPGQDAGLFLSGADFFFYIADLEQQGFPPGLCITVGAAETQKFVAPFLQFA